MNLVEVKNKLFPKALKDFLLHRLLEQLFDNKYKTNNAKFEKFLDVDTISSPHFFHLSFLSFPIAQQSKKIIQSTIHSSTLPPNDVVNVLLTL